MQACILLIPNLICWFIFYPGYFQADHQELIANIINGEPNQGNSLVWAFLALPFLYYSPSYAVYGLFQISIFVFCVVFGIYRLKKCGFIKNTLILTIIMALFPTFLIYNELYSSELILTYFVFLVTCCLIEFVMAKDNKVLKVSFWILLFTSILFCCLMRKTALLIPVVVFLCALILKKKEIKKFFLICMMCVFCTVSMDFAFSTIMNAKSAIERNVNPIVAIPSYQISGVYAADGFIPDDARNVFESMKPAKEWADSYKVASIDVSAHNVTGSCDFIEAYLKTGFFNFFQYIKSYLRLEGAFYIFSYNVGFDKVDRDNGTGIDFDQHDDITIKEGKKANSSISDEYLEQFTTDKSNLWKLPKNTILDCHNSNIGGYPALVDVLLFNRALPFWVLLIGSIVALKKRKLKQFLFVSGPVLSIFIVFALCCPVVLFRYVAEMYYTLPILILAIFKLLKNYNLDNFNN